MVVDGGLLEDEVVAGAEAAAAAADCVEVTAWW